jgi:hypothetical protein
MAYNIIGNISEASRIIVLNESDMSIESNTTHSGGAFDVTANDDNDKIIIARKNDGESFGYGAITPIMTGPVLVEGFDTDINNWSLSTYYSNCFTRWDWQHGGSMWHSGNSGGGLRSTYAVWDIGLSGNFDVELDFINTSLLSEPTRSSQYFAYLKPVHEAAPGSDYLRIISSDTGNALQHGLVVGGSSVSNNITGTPVWTGKFRFTRSGDVYNSYHDLGSGWVLGNTYNHSGWDTLYLMSGVNSNRSQIFTYIKSVTVNTGTIVQ